MNHFNFEVISQYNVFFCLCSLVLIHVKVSINMYYYILKYLMTWQGNNRLLDTPTSLKACRCTYRPYIKPFFECVYHGGFITQCTVSVPWWLYKSTKESFFPCKNLYKCDLYGQSSLHRNTLWTMLDHLSLGLDFFSVKFSLISTDQ